MIGWLVRTPIGLLALLFIAAAFVSMFVANLFSLLRAWGVEIGLGVALPVIATVIGA
ncbi:MAG: hypothetical protein R6U01_11950 [Halorubrum sp.]|uniref:hypothetical protein n=1 Tax=Halorubrum sp. TaxID=1879286 RepID=UPI003970E033